VDGSAELALEAAGQGTRVHWLADVTVGGQVARLGQRMLSGVTREMAAQFFETFERAGVAATAAPADASAPTDPAGETRAAAAPEPPSPLAAGLRLLWRLLLRALRLRRDPRP
jgi:hypothetical protein